MSPDPKPAELRIRPFLPGDFPRLCALWQDTGIFRPERMDGPDTIARTLLCGGFLLLLEQPSAPMLLGSVWVTQDGRRAYLHHLAIHPQRQRQGLGRWLLTEALARAENLGLDIKIEVLRDHPARNLYLGSGFVPLGNYETLILRRPLRTERAPKT